MILKLSYKNQKYLVTFEPDNTLEELYDAAAEISGLNATSITLVHSGFKLPYVKEPVKNFGIGSNSTVACLPLKRNTDGDGSKARSSHQKSSSDSNDSAPPHPQSSIPSMSSLSQRAAKLAIPDLASLPPFETSFTAFHPPSKCTSDERKQMEALARLLATEHMQVEPFIREYLNLAVNYLDPLHSEKPIEKQLKDAYAKASELLLQSLLKIDGIQAPQGSQLIRVKRKEAVQLIQSWLKVVDGIKSRIAHAQETQELQEPKEMDATQAEASSSHKKSHHHKHNHTHHRKNASPQQ